ncbi:unnamed protein product, partial [Rotaria sp. Silwood1]
NGLEFVVNVVVVVVDDMGDDGGDNFISARFLFTPCSTGSNSNPLSPSKQQQSIFNSSPNKNQSLVFKKPCSLTALTSSSSS